MAKPLSGEEQAKAAREALHEIDKLRLKFEAERGAGSHFPDFQVNHLLLISDLAGDALKREEAVKRTDG
jgi:hypothetical protein